MAKPAGPAAAHAAAPGASAPLGATVQPGGVNFSVFSKGASREHGADRLEIANRTCPH